MSTELVIDDRPLLALRDVRKRFGGLQAVDGVSLSLLPGELRCVIGPNGAGKSTLFKLIIGTFAPDSGQILFDDRDISRFTLWQRGRIGIGIKMQVPALYQGLTAYENLHIAVQQQRVLGRAAVEEEINRFLSLLGLSEIADTRVEHLSHGQQQWLEIGVALGMKPRLLLLDEPTAGMSPEETQKTAELVDALTRDGIAVMVIEHDMAFVRLIAKKITVLHQGKVLVEGSSTEVEANEDVLTVYLGKA